MNTSDTTMQFIHEPLNNPVQAIGGQYSFIKESMLSYQDKKILYLVGCALFDNTCCGTGGVGYAMVPGSVISWKCKISKDGYPISTILPITDAQDQESIKQIIIQKETVFQVQFLPRT